MNQDLNQRNIQILNTIIEEYIATAAPVGSKVVAQNSNLKLSPASMRNSMAELTELGFLEQPHTSAGRIPTSKAFRLYIDSLLYVRPLDEDAETAIMQSLACEEMEINSIFRRAAGLMAARCNQVSMLLAPERKSARWSGIGFTKSGRNRVLAVLALEGGMVETRLISTGSNFSVSELLRFSNYLNAHFKGMSLWAARQAILIELAGTEHDLEQIFKQALTLGVQAVDNVDTDRELFVDGTRTIFNQAEFADIDSVREMFAFLEEKPVCSIFWTRR
jgi:heat-inducible transcription repressor HrcA